MYVRTMKKPEEICPAKTLLALLGQPHILTVIHTLAGGEWGFSQLQQVTKINSRTLSLRLRLLQAEHIIKSVECTEDARCRYYSLTQRGKHIHKILVQLDAV